MTHSWFEELEAEDEIEDGFFTIDDEETPDAVTLQRAPSDDEPDAAIGTATWASVLEGFVGYQRSW